MVAEEHVVPSFETEAAGQPAELQNLRPRALPLARRLRLLSSSQRQSRQRRHNPLLTRSPTLHPNCLRALPSARRFRKRSRLTNPLRWSPLPSWSSSLHPFWPRARRSSPKDGLKASDHHITIMPKVCGSRGAPGKADGAFEGLQEGSFHSSLKPVEVVVAPSVPGADLTSPALHPKSPVREQPRVGPSNLRSVGSTSQGSCSVQGSRVYIGAEGAETTRAIICPSGSQEAAPTVLHSQRKEALHHHCVAAAVAEVDGDGHRANARTNTIDDASSQHVDKEEEERLGSTRVGVLSHKAYSDYLHQSPSNQPRGQGIRSLCTGCDLQNGHWQPSSKQGVDGTKAAASSAAYPPTAPTDAQ